MLLMVNLIDYNFIFRYYYAWNIKQVFHRTENHPHIILAYTLVKFEPAYNFAHITMYSYIYMYIEYCIIVRQKLAYTLKNIKIDKFLNVEFRWKLLLWHQKKKVI